MCNLSNHPQIGDYNSWKHSSAPRAENSQKSPVDIADQTHLKDLEQGLHVEPSDAKRYTKNGRDDDENKQQGEPYSEGNAQKHAE